MADPLDEMVLKLTGDVSGLKASLNEAILSIKETSAKTAEHTGKMTESFLKAEVAVEFLKKGFEKLKEMTVDMIADSLQQIDHQAKLADRLGVTTEFIGAMTTAGAELGLGIDEITSSMQRFERGLAEAAKTGQGPVHDALQILQLDEKKLADESPEQAQRDVMDAMKGVADQATRTQVAVALYGREGAKMVSFLSQGSEALDEARKKAELYGTAVSRFDAAKVEQANNAWRDLKERMEGIANTVTIAIAPALVAIAKYFDANAVSSKAFGTIASAVVDYVAQGLDGVRYIIHGVQIAWDTFKVSVTLLALAFTSLFDVILKGFVYVGELLGNFGIAMSRTETLIKDTFVIGFKLAFDAVEQFTADTMGAFAQLLLKTSEGMTAAGIKGADSVRSAAESIQVTAGALSAKAQKAAQDNKIAWTNSAEDVKFAWKNILPTFSDIKIPFLDNLVDKYKDKLAGFSLDLKQSLEAPFDGHKVRDWLELVTISVEAAARKTADSMQRAAKSTSLTLKDMANIDLVYYLSNLDQRKLAEEEYYQNNLAALKQNFAITNATTAQQNQILEEENKRHQKVMAAIQLTEATKLRNEQFEADRAQHDAEVGTRHTDMQNELHEWMDLHKQEIDDTETFFSNIGSLTQTHNKRLFEIGKAAQLAGAIVSTARGVANALADVPYPYNFAAAAAVGIAGAVQIAKIATTQFGSGGGGTSSVGSPAAAPGAGAAGGGVTGQQAQGQNVTIALQGSIFNDQTIRALADQLNQFKRDGGQLGFINVQS